MIEMLLACVGGFVLYVIALIWFLDWMMARRSRSVIQETPEGNQ